MRASGARFLLGSTVFALVFAGLACGDDDPAPTGAPPATGGAAGTAGTAGTAGVAGIAGTAGASGTTPPGSYCACDSECLGTPDHPGICLLGMCMQQATAECPSRGVQDGCPAGSLCFNTEMLPGVGVCWPEADQVTCAGAENRHGVCSPIRGTQCDSSCGVACEASQAAFGKPGGSCLSEGACDLPGDAMCYEDEDFPGNYCLKFGCQFDLECGTEAACFPLASDGSGVCMDLCGMDFDCREGYVCAKSDTHNSAYCFAGCDEAATCPTGFLCVGNGCIPEGEACTPQNPTGRCPGDDRCENGECVPKDPPCSAQYPYGVCTNGEFCNNGVCGPFACNDALMEPNNSRATALDAPLGATQGLTVCPGDEDWYRITIPPQTIAKVGIEFDNDQGDLDLVAYDANGELLGSRVGDMYPYPDHSSWYAYETNNEYFGFYSQTGSTEYYVRAVGSQPSGSPAAAHNQYTLLVTHYEYRDGPNCEAAGFTTADCQGLGPDGSGLLPFPFPDPNDSVVGNEYMHDSVGNYRFARRELIMLVRHSLAETEKAFPGTNPLGIIDICQIDGITPGYDVNDPRHPETTHDQGANMDLAYYQTDSSNESDIICGDGSVHNDGFCSPAAASSHIVDLDRQAFFMAQITASDRTRVIGVDQVIAPLIQAAAQGLAALPDGDPRKITLQQAGRVTSRMAYGSGWPYHHHHIHLSLQWWGSTRSAVPSGETGVSIFRVAPQPVTMDTLDMAWPPRPVLPLLR